MGGLEFENKNLNRINTAIETHFYTLLYFYRTPIIKSEPFEVTGDVLVFAGDTGYLRDRTLPNLRFCKWASANYREVLLVPGNHEFYGKGDVLAYGDSWSREILPNVHFYQNKVVRIDNVDFILSTL